MTTPATASSDSTARPRMIERWFPCKEVSEASQSGWGTAEAEAKMFVWFAKRPLAQARAAALTSLLPWPEDSSEQERLRAIVQEAMGFCSDPNHKVEGRRHKYGIQCCALDDKTNGYMAAFADAVGALRAEYPNGFKTLDSFSGRGILPLESARYGATAHGVDASALAVLASRCLTDYPTRNWDGVPPLPWTGGEQSKMELVADDKGGLRLPGDVEAFLAEVTNRSLTDLSEFFPKGPEGRYPWGYVWATEIVCEGCGREFPVLGRLELASESRRGPGQHIALMVTGQGWHAEVRPGEAENVPTLRSGKGQGKTAYCLHCSHPHSKATHNRILSQGGWRDVLLAVADLESDGSKIFRTPTEEETQAALRSEKRLAELSGQSAYGHSVIPDELFPEGKAGFMAPLVYGVERFAEAFHPRQALMLATLAMHIAEAADEVSAVCGAEYARAMAAYGAAALSRKVKFSSRGAAIHPTSNPYMGHIFSDGGGLGYGFDYFETGIGSGPGSWNSLVFDKSQGLVGVLHRFIERNSFEGAGYIFHGTARRLPFKDDTYDAVITDPPYDEMIQYADVSDIIFVWAKRAIASVDPGLTMMLSPEGTQDKSEELIVSRSDRGAGDHRTTAWYDEGIAQSLAEARRVLHGDGVVSIVFGHGEPEVWERLLGAISGAGLVLTGSWPARTEKNTKTGYANIATTLTLSCRPASQGRPVGRVAEVDAEVRREVASRIPIWEAAGLALTDQLMAAAGPAMEVVGRYSTILDKRGEPVDIARYLPLARHAVEEAADIRIDSLPLGTFDVRTRFALFWARLYGRLEAPASEARWQRLAADLEDADTEGVLTTTRKGVRLATSQETDRSIDAESPLVDVALAMAAVRKTGLADVGEVVIASGRAGDDEYLWACLGELAVRLPDADADGESFTWLVRNRDAVVASTRDVASARRADADAREQSPTMFDIDNGKLFPDEGTLFSQGDDR